MRFSKWSLVAFCLAAAFVACGSSRDEDEGRPIGSVEPMVEPSDEPTQHAGGAGPSAPVEIFSANPFVATAHDPLSTFAADVDTASYGYFKHNHRWLIESDRIRVEEFVNAFDYSYPAPTSIDTHPIAIHLDITPSVAAPTTMLRVGVQGMHLPLEQRPRANLVFLVDSSGSMFDELPSVQTLLFETLGLLDEEDTLSIVTYGGITDTPLPATPASEVAKIRKAIEDLRSGGSTNGEGGLNVAYDQASGAYIPGGINHVILCTDGDFNVGLETIEELVDLIVQKRKTGITLTGVGFGQGDFNDELMENISNWGNGIYDYVGERIEARTYARERMLQTLMHIARDVKFQIEFNPSLVHAYRLVGYESRALSDVTFRDDAVDAGEIGSGHSVTALYELVLEEQDLPPLDSRSPPFQTGAPQEMQPEVSPEDIVLVKARYKLPSATENEAATEVQARLSRFALNEQSQSSDPDTLWAVGVAGYAELLKESPFVTHDAQQALLETLRMGSEAREEREEFVEIVSQYFLKD